MWEDFTGFKPDKPIGNKIEAASSESPQAPEKRDGPKIDPAADREQRIEAIDAKRESELTQLNAARARLGLPPSNTNVAIAALDAQQARLMAFHKELTQGPAPLKPCLSRRCLVESRAVCAFSISFLSPT